MENVWQTRKFQDYHILVKNHFRNQVKSRKSYLGADCVSEHRLVGKKFHVKLKKIFKVERKQTN